MKKVLVIGAVQWASASSSHSGFEDVTVLALMDVRTDVKANEKLVLLVSQVLTCIKGRASD